uniref:Uncharacterized protein n=1 Tax=Glossina palpalis gambiensis TaxID=67801 RepID=A0A1B0AP51_9MUSC
MFAGHLKNYNNSNEFFGQQSNEFLKATSIKRKQEQKLEENSFIISPDVNNRSLVLGNMRIAKGNDTESRASPSLAQEMNLARRACWCNNRSLLPVSINEMDEQKCCENKCFKNNYEDNVVTNAIAKTTTTTKTKTTKILNGAENFSKILFNKHTNDNVVSNDKKDDGNERAIENVSILVNNYNYNYNNNDNYYDGDDDDDDDDDETITNNLSEMENVNLVKLCLFFSCINRIEGRPESSDSIPGVTDATKAINLAQSLVPNAIKTTYEMSFPDQF